MLVGSHRLVVFAWCATLFGFLVALFLLQFNSGHALVALGPFLYLVALSPAAVVWSLAGARWYWALCLYFVVIGVVLITGGLIAPGEAMWLGPGGQRYSPLGTVVNTATYAAILSAVNLLPIGLVFAAAFFVRKRLLK